MASTQTAAFPLASEGYAGDSSSAGAAIDNDGGASGASSSNVGISRGGLVAIIIVVVVVALLGTTSAVLFYLAKKREWKIRENIRKSARKVVAALTPRRSEFPRSVKEESRRSAAAPRGRMRLVDDVPPTPRLPKDLDLEKGRDDDTGRKGIKIKLSTFARKS